MSYMEWVSTSTEPGALVPATQGVHVETAKLIIAGCVAEVQGEATTSAVLLNAAIGVEAKWREHDTGGKPVVISKIVGALLDLVDRLETEINTYLEAHKGDTDNGRNQRTRTAR